MFPLVGPKTILLALRGQPDLVYQSNRSRLVDLKCPQYFATSVLYETGRVGKMLAYELLWDTSTETRTKPKEQEPSWKP